MPLHVDIDVAGEPRKLRALLEGLVALNVEIMDEQARRGRPLPPLYDAGVRYEKERGTEHWQPADELLRSSAGDCEDLSGYRAAELRRLGEPASVDVVPASRRGSYHAIVRRANGEVEDPSVIILTRSKKMENGNTVIDVREDGSCVVGEVEIPTEDGPITVQSSGVTGGDALTRAVDTAQQIMDDPAVAPFVPPQARAAVAGARVLAKAAQAGGGILHSLFGRLNGGNKRNLVRKLLETSRGGSQTVHVSGLGALSIGATTVRDHRKPRRRVTSQSQPYGGYPPPYGGYPQDPYAYPPYYGGGGQPSYPPGYQGYPPYGGYPPVDPYGGYGQYAPVDPWAQWAGYGWGAPASPWASVMAEQFGSQALDAMWPSFQSQASSYGGGW